MSRSTASWVGVPSRDWGEIIVLTMPGAPRLAATASGAAAVSRPFRDALAAEPARRTASAYREIDYPADDFTIEQIGVGVVDVIEPVTLGDHLVEQQLTGLIELRQPGHVGSRVA